MRLTFQRRVLIASSALLFAALSVGNDTLQPAPLIRAHAHNDYDHPRPLLDALDHGFCNVEADVYLTPQGLLVSHDLIGLKPERTLESLYLAPLQALVKKQNGSVHSAKTPFTLLIDIKTQAEATYAALTPLLEKYAPMLSVTKDGVVQPGAVTIVISGNRPIETISKQTMRYAGIDGRPADLNAMPPLAKDLMPWISGRWGESFTWKGEGEIPAAERQKLHDMAARAHRQSRRLRFWATPENEAVWRELRAADVDLIGTDDLGRLQRFLTAESNRD